jgi:hypothetical protein
LVLGPTELESTLQEGASDSNVDPADALPDIAFDRSQVIESVSVPRGSKKTAFGGIKKLVNLQRAGQQRLSDHLGGTLLVHVQAEGHLIPIGRLKDCPEMQQSGHGGC